ncbi:MAG: T9SS type A sorting domain-containing protein [Bacteroidia bacterium]|nr:T9SS type A sorting domain-containing protein [Bacteroidia bacterium]MCF8427370.1 T9SS type A sorting domain-containing protein [Bacteroidia bacterium]MCF8447257.1 T9SS type A sorting domain-containing protein [Bacteroidia bacterium]
MKRILSILSLIICMGSENIMAQNPGTLDVSYGVNGKMSATFPAKNGSSLYIYDLQKVADGKLIGIMNKSYYDAINETYTDTVVVFKVLANGNPDAGFGVNGEIKTNLVPMFILPQQDGKILIGFNDQEELVMMRFLSNGSVDVSYGIEGTSYTGIFAEVSNGVQESNGDLTLLGSVKNNSAMLIAKLKSNGERQFDFGKDGLHVFDFDAFNYYEWPSQILLQNDGKMVVLGNEYSNGNYAFVCRLNKDGSYDSSFSSDGKLRINSTMGTNAMKLLDNGKIILGGTYYYSNYTKSGFAIASVNADGTMDASFGSNGLRNFNFGGQDDFLYSILVQEDGKILAAGSTTGKFALARIHKNGTYDLSFNTTGKTTIEFDAGSTSSAHFMSFEADQKIWVSGLIRHSDLSVGFCSARFHLGNTVGLLERENSLQASVYPNPFKESITIEVSIDKKDFLSANLYSLEGRLIENLLSSTQMAKGSYKLDLPSNNIVGSGIYLLQIKMGEREKWIKVVKD